MLASVFGGDAVNFTHDSDTLPGVTRSYARLSQAAQEICDSRVYVGYHFRWATTTGRAQGQQVGRAVIDRLLAPNFG